MTKLETFLRQNRVLTLFKKNLAADPYEESFDKYARDIELYCLADSICSAFIFHETPEGSMFWTELSVRWEEYCKHLN